MADTTVATMVAMMVETGAMTAEMVDSTGETVDLIDDQLVRIGEDRFEFVETFLDSV
jgi:hypothetical protein